MENDNSKNKVMQIFTVKWYPAFSDIEEKVYICAYISEDAYNFMVNLFKNSLHKVKCSHLYEEKISKKPGPVTIKNLEKGETWMICSGMNGKKDPEKSWSL
jgi:hypothetical protein